MFPNQYLFLASLSYFVCSVSLSLESNVFSLLGIDSYMPNPNQMKTKKLLRRLGRHFNPEYMSLNNPIQDNTRGGGEHHVEISSFSRDDISAWLSTVHPMGDLSNNTISEVIHVLQQVSNCNINFSWEELDSLYFPRFIKTGSCVSRGSCSWPPGMVCQPAQVKVIRILRWRCKSQRRISSSNKHKNRTRSTKKKNKRTRVDIGGKVKCNWKLIPREVTIKCSCTC